MKNQLTIEIADQRGACLRVLSLVERRQFEVRSLTCTEGHRPATLAVEMVLGRGPLGIESLLRQIEKLSDVVSVSSSSRASAASAAQTCA